MLAEITPYLCFQPIKRCTITGRLNFFTIRAGNQCYTRLTSFGVKCLLFLLFMCPTFADDVHPNSAAEILHYSLIFSVYRGPSPISQGPWNY
jgi:hypothetical protein